MQRIPRQLYEFCRVEFYSNVTNGSITFEGQDITDASSDKRAKAGMFLSFQNPYEVPGISLSSFIRNAYHAQTGAPVKLLAFQKSLKAAMEILSMDESYADRDLNVGFSGGEKKKAEILQLLMLNPKFAILDETDSGLDVDAVRTVSKGIEEYQKKKDGALLRVEFYSNQFYHKEPEGISFCPYRISPLGAHIDHQYGKINGFAIDKGIHIAYSAKMNGVIEVQSVDFPKRAQFHVMSIPDEKVGDWADHLRGAAKELSEKYPLRIGLSAVIEGSLPIGGLSSSAAVIIAFLSALAKVNNIVLDQWEAIMMAKAAENKYVGVNCGKLDQSCEVLCKKNNLLYLDCADDSYELIPKSENMKPFKIAIFFSGLERSLANSD